MFIVSNMLRCTDDAKCGPWISNIRSNRNPQRNAFMATAKALTATQSYIIEEIDGGLDPYSHFSLHRI